MEQTPVQNPVIVEQKRRAAMVAAQPNSQDAQRQADKAHLANLGFPDGNIKAKPVPRHIELAPEVEKELAGMTPEQFAAKRRDGKLSETVREAFAVVPEPSRNALQLLEFTNCSHRLVAPAHAHPLVLSENFKFWSSLSNSVNLHDWVFVIASDNSWNAHYQVTQRSENRASARLILGPFYNEPEQLAIPDWVPEGYELVALGPEHPMPGYGIKRLRDKFMMLDNSGHPFPTIENARRFLADHAVFRKESSTQYFP